jgi:hypothetical protein
MHLLNIWSETYIYIIILCLYDTTYLYVNVEKPLRNQGILGFGIGAPLRRLSVTFTVICHTSGGRLLVGLLGPPAS